MHRSLQVPSDCSHRTLLIPGLILVFLLLMPMLSFAGIFGSDSIDFTVEEKGQFQDSFDRFPKKYLPDIIPMGGAVWLDNQHVIMTVKELPDGWDSKTMLIPKSALSPVVAPHLDTSRIITVDVMSNAIQDSLYSSGSLLCSDNGRIVIGIPPTVGADDEYFSGKYGEKLKPMTQLAQGHRPELIGVNCNEMDNAGQFIVFHLMPQHGTLRLTKSMGLGPDSITNAYLFDSDDKPVATLPLFSDAKPLGLRYLAYRNQYVAENIVSYRTEHSGVLISPDGSYTYIDSDPFLASLAQKYRGTGRVKMTSIGPFWTFQSTFDRWEQRGLFFRENGKLLRIDDSAVGSLAVSPDGCKLFYDRTSGNPRTVINPKWNFGRRKLVVLDLCENPDKK